MPTTTTTREHPAESAASTTQQIIGLPKILCETFAWLDFMRVPSPAAMMIAVTSIGIPSVCLFARGARSDTRTHVLR